MPKRLAYLGPAGTHTEQAAAAYGPDATHLPFESIPAVASAVDAHLADEGIVPIENSLEGPVTFTLDLLIHESSLFIRHELVLPIHHALLGRPGSDRADIEMIYSHPQALAQCREFLERCFPKAQLIASLSTVAAVEDMVASPTPAAAISPRRAAELYSMEVLAESIQDNSNNVTRFVALAKTDHPPTGKDKTSICFSFAEDKPGMLYNALGEFAIRNINLAKIESRPTKESLGMYWFLVDFEGHREEPRVKGVLDFIRSQTSMLKIFGSYPRWGG